ncbi:MAG: hypothetical protein GEU73_06695 [Chloroflexi bacterium]|nr:hypothetical protein [Chloroflexota bacterium]
MDLSGLEAGAHIELEDLSVGEVLESSPDGETIRVRYLESPFDPDLVGTEARVSWDIVAGLVTGENTTTRLGGELRPRNWVG